MHFDYSVLSQPVTYKEIIKAFKKQPTLYKFAVGTVALINVGILVIFLTIFLSFSWKMTDGSNQINGLFIWAIAFIAITLGLPLTFITSLSKEIRFRRFALANNIEFYAGSMQDSRNGLVFQKGDTKRFDMLFTPTKGNIKEFGNYSYSIENGKNSHTRTYGFIHIKLPRKLPNMVLDSHTNNLFGESGLPENFSKSQVVQLEGDFNKYFTLYAPEEYKRDALYIFTPDVMQAMVDASNHYDGEIVDDDFYLYTSQLTISDIKTVEELLTIAESIAKQLDEQAGRYSDERVGRSGQNMIAAPGVRLRRSVAVQAVVVLALVTAAYAIITIMYN